MAAIGTLPFHGFNLSSIRRNPVRAAASAATVAPPFSYKNRKNSLYDVLRVKETASRDEIKRAYRSMAKLAHPDVISSGGFDEFVQIRRAYETLSDPMARARYDLSIGRILSLDRIGFGFGRWETDQCW